MAFVLNNNGSACEVNTDHQSYVYFNLSGIRFQITETAFALLNPKVIADANTSFNTELNHREYFFTRNSQSFTAILDYLENGALHLPLSICPFAFQDEMEFWCIKEKSLELCCKRRIQESEKHEALLNRFTSSFDRHRPHYNLASSNFEKFRQRGWEILDNPASSGWAKLVLAIKTFAIVIFILESACATHSLFQKRIPYADIPKYIDLHKDTFTVLCNQTDHTFAQNNILRDLCIILDANHSDHHRQHGNESNADAGDVGGTNLVSKRDTLSIPSGTFTAHSIISNKQTENANKRVKQYIMRHDEPRRSAYLIAQSKRHSNVSEHVLDEHEPIMSRVNFQHITTAGDDGGSSSSVNRRTLRSDDSSNGSVGGNSRSIDGNIRSSDRTDKSVNRTVGSEERPGVALRVKRDITFDRVHPPELIDDHASHIEDLVIIESVQWIYLIELIVTVYFVMEYIVELIFAPDKLNYVTSFYSMIDLSTIVCLVSLHVIDLLNPGLKYTDSNWEYLKAVESLKTLKLFSLVKDTRSYKVILFSVKNSYKDFITILIYVSIMLTIVSFFMYFLEKENMESIFNAMWWAVVAVTTVSYGDVVPKSNAGKWLGSVCALSGILMTAIMVPIFAEDFVTLNNFSKDKRNKKNTRTIRLIFNPSRLMLQTNKV